MDRASENSLTRQQIWAALRRVWRQLLIYELLMSLVSTVILGPLLLTYSYWLIGISDEAVLGNWELAWFLLSPRGALMLVVLGSVSLGLLFVEYAGLMLLIESALRPSMLSLRQILAGMVAAAPWLFGLAVLHTSLAILLALPFLGLAAICYWLLLGDADINYYLDARPWQYWAAMCAGLVLVGGFALAIVGVFARWAFAVPACVLDGGSGLDALRSSARLMRGRTLRLLWILGGWQLLKLGAFTLAIAGLDWSNAAWLARFEGSASSLVWSTVGLVLVDAIALQLLAAGFAIGTALWISVEYERARRACGDDRAARPADRGASRPSNGPVWKTHAAIVALAIVAPLTSIGYALVAARTFVEHRPIWVTGHRAGPSAAPENSLAALQLSIDAGADFAEVDVQLTADGQVVLLHDRDLRRVTGDPRVLTDLNFADLGDLRLMQNGQATDQRISTLAEIVVAAGNRIRLNVELKDFGSSPGLAVAVVEVLREHKFTDRAIASCFQLPPLEEIRQAEPQVPVGIIISASKGDLTRLPVQFLSLNHRQVRADLVRRAHRRGMEVHAWSIGDRETALRMLDLGCDNLITSDPAQMRELVDWYSDRTDAERLLLRLRRWMRE